MTIKASKRHSRSSATPAGQSSTARQTPSRRKLSSPASRTDSLPKLPCGLTFVLSQPEDLEAWLTRLSQVSPASQSVSPGRGLAQKIHDGSLVKLRELYGSAPRPSCFLRMFPASWSGNPAVVYLAGLLDGEGCLTIAKNKKYFYPTIEIGMTDKALPILRQIHATFGGSMCRMKRQTEKWHSAHKWSVSGEAAARIAGMVIPFLQLKKRQAEILINAYRIYPKPKPGKYRGRWTKEIYAGMEKLRQEMTLLNRKGPNVCTLREDMPPGWVCRLEDGRWVSPQGSLLTEDHLEQFSGPWPKSGMCLDGYVYPLPMWERRTVEKDGGALPAWATPQSVKVENDNKIYVGPNNAYFPDGRKCQPTLSDQSRMWASPRAAERWSTPRSSPNENRQTKPAPSQLEGRHGWNLSTEVNLWKSPRVSRGGYTRDGGDQDKERMTLEGEVKAWATPNSSEGKTAYQKGRIGTGKQINLSTEVCGAEVRTERGSLNPDWEELLMGWPMGWSDPDKPCAGIFTGWPAGQGSFQHDYEPPRTVPKGSIQNRTKRVEMIGNGVVPMCAAEAFRILLRGVL